ncbi:hypothetical protein MNB_SM-7-1338 [hydrothermal vent metagenome]|uniref:Uncharacterized protein n=1 Tax=hydrothermal vent metagenome TaxID=652676 RepID=A0A1W1BY25_9ZZZZ
MKKFNLLKEIIIVDQKDLLKAINSQQEFGITLNGDITFKPDKHILIYKGKYVPKTAPLSPPTQSTIVQDLLGDDYKTAQSEGKIGIKAAKAFRKIAKINYEKALYDDTSADGVFEFADKKLEEIGWYADEFGITYRELIELLEEKAKGVLLCIEQEKPSYQFSGLGFVDNIDEAYELLYSFAQKRIKEKIENDPLFSKEKLTKDEKEAANYFKAL